MDEEKKFDQNKYIVDWQRKNVTSANMHFNRTKPEDMEMLAWIKSQPEGVTGYLKRLVREDMSKAGK